ncbi:putative M6 family metalloprotease domain-containing protein [Seiridium unicorne]|uniref:M6 family metalloprotease domain-containing protein n=1 Tax=Seiridium unicorne TaxID=138068 RepID=A0ABR2VIJ7_9PEZI
MAPIRRAGRRQALMTILASLSDSSKAAPVAASSECVLDVPCGSNPFDIIDAQNWVNPDNMTWADFIAPPGTNWSDSTRTGSERNFNIALVTIDYSDRPFVVTQPTESTVYGNPLPGAPQLTRDQVPGYYRDLLNTPNDLNNGHTLHEYWMGDSHGRYGVDLTTFGPYEMPYLAWQYGISADMNSGGCPTVGSCNHDIRTDAYALWRADVGNDTADSFELVFFLTAGQDESSTWQEFGEMKFLTKDDVPNEFGPPDDVAPDLANYAKTRYVEWTSWAAASNTWPNAADGSSTQAESSGMSTYAHELSHLLDIGDNYNNPYGTPLRRAYAGPFSMMDRGSFNGPGGPHTRWQIPALQGGSMGSLHTVRDKAQLGLISNTSILHLSREALVDSGLIVAEVTARAVDPGEDGLIGIRVNMGEDLSPTCSIETDVLCDGGDYNHYHVEVIDRMGADSFQPDHGVLISKTKEQDSQPFVWVIDANPQDIELVDFYRPNGSAAYITLGDYRQLADALFHAGTRSGSEYEYMDEANNLHFYIINIDRGVTGILSYTVGVRSLNGTAGPSTHSLSLDQGKVQGENATGEGLWCTFPLTNTGTYVEGESGHPDDASAYLDSDIFRLNATVEGDGWLIEVPNTLTTAKFGSPAEAKVAVAASAETASDTAVVTLTVTSESDSSVVTSATCEVQKQGN